MPELHVNPDRRGNSPLSLLEICTGDSDVGLRRTLSKY